MLGTLITVVIAVGASAGIWVVANLIVNQVKIDWSRYRALTLGLLGFFGGVLLSGNLITRYSGPADGALAKFGYWVWLPLLTGLGAAAVGYFLGRVEAPTTRLAIGAGGLAALGVFAGAMVRNQYRPEIEIGWLAVCTIVGAAIAAVPALLRRRSPVAGALIGAAAGWVVGAWGVPDHGAGSAGWTIVAMAVPPALIGARLALGTIPGETHRSLIDQRARAIVFIGPALLFIFGALVVPALRTLLLSLKSRDSSEFVWFDNYADIFRDENSWNPANWTDTFTSRLFWIGLILLVAFVILGAMGRRQTGRTVELGSPSMGPLVVGGFLVSLAVFSTVRGTIANNLWWVVVVTLLSTAVGLAIAVLADGARFEKVAKSLVFMPMAISMVGASVIWRFMYVARDSSTEQTGVMNGIWVGLGRLSTGEKVASTLLVAVLIITLAAGVIRRVADRNWIGAGIAVAVGIAGVLVLNWLWNLLDPEALRIVVGVVISLVFVGLVVAVARALVKRTHARAVLPGVVALALGWFLIRYWQIIGGGVGGQRVNSGGRQVPDPINFIQEPPFNNMWLMVVLIWIQTGFAMVILSAAIKAVPTELIEAAKVDGATTSQVFWRVTLPQVGTTIGVVVTTLMVLVMKVYDIVQVLTNGNFGTQVLANNMFNETFSNRDFGIGSALAMLIFVSVLPIIYMNIRRMQKEA